MINMTYQNQQQQDLPEEIYELFPDGDVPEPPPSDLFVD
jgi:hypothetical protein